MFKNYFNWAAPRILIYLSLISQLIIPNGSTRASAIIFPAKSDTTPTFWSDVCFYKGSENNTQVEVYYSIALKELKFTNRQSLSANITGEYLAAFACSLTVKNAANQTVFQKIKHRKARARSQSEVLDKSRGIIDQIVLDLQPGNYNLELAIHDEESKKVSKITGDLSVPEFKNTLCISDLQLALNFSENRSQKLFIKGNRHVIPNSSRRYRYHDSTLYLYFEVYNLPEPTVPADEYFKIGYSIIDTVGDTLIMIPFLKIKKPGTSCIKLQALDIRGLEAGEHSLVVNVLDPASNQSVIRQKNFWIIKPSESLPDRNLVTGQRLEPGDQKTEGRPTESSVLSMTPEDVIKYRDQIKYFATEKELKLYDQLGPNGKTNFLINFWRSMDNTPESPENEFMQNSFSRIDYANKHFKNGLNSDMGRIFIIYGQPDDIENHLMKMNSKSYVIWYYYIAGKNHMFAFVDRNNENIFSLVHSTVLDEIKNNNWMELEL